MEYNVLGAAKYGGKCVKCGSNLRDYEAVLLRGKNGKFAVACAYCLTEGESYKSGGKRMKAAIRADSIEAA